MTTTSGSDVCGDVGTSPIAGTAITGFALSPSNTGSVPSLTSTLVDGGVFVVSNKAPTPTVLTTAVIDIEAAYVDAATRANPDYTNLNSGGTSIDGLELSPSLYKWTTDVTVPVDGSFILSGSATDIWIIQIAGNLAIGSGGRRTANRVDGDCGLSLLLKVLGERASSLMQRRRSVE